MSVEEGNKNKEIGLKKFLLDPKAGVNSVRTYLAENSNNTHHSNGPASSQNLNQPQYSNNSAHLGPNTNSSFVPANQQFPSRPSSSASFHPALSQQQQQPNSLGQQPIQQQAQQQNQHINQQQNQNQQQHNTPYSLTSNILDFLGHPETNQSTPPSTNQNISNVQQEAPYPATVMYPAEAQVAHHFAGATLGSQLELNRNMYNSSPGLAPPPADSTIGVASAPRLYHRMILEFETLKSIFYAARVQPFHNNLIPVVTKLKALAREIWNLRYTRANEFDYAEAAHQPIIIFWKEQFEQWSDTLEDMHDPILMQRLALVDQENNYPAMAGLAIAGLQAPGSLLPVAQQAPLAPGLSAQVPAASPAAPAPSPTPVATQVKKTVAKKVATAAPSADGEAAPVVKKKVVKKAAAVDGEDPPVVKKKVVKKKVAAE
ncbi:hypothetical protein HYFRA_00010959 [Hymenoscyphus fraxineus]|uniref:Uncharacterized protein n=1 Tax=Hymenoscyphus fraxineus TaxID=746836 RepID=A0A9N9L012_9HELO|nr:hypothetical protein HYFRA_00010959 [Hymenoscyphus fraxineus]